MTEKDFILKKAFKTMESGEITWESPSNIALVKYWGKKKNQIPENPSLSFTLKNCKTTTTMAFQKKKSISDDFDFELFLDHKKQDSFRPKIQQFFERVEIYLPFLKEYTFTINTSNTFPHSSGIASSASGMSALALCLVRMEKKINPEITTEYFKKKASFLARLGSGSACRSIEGELMVWGKHKTIEGSNNLYAIKYPDEVHENFKGYQDVILLVDKGKKKVSSSLGHNLMNNHPFAQQRFAQAHENMEKLQGILQNGNIPTFIALVESEALTLHAMMMTGNPYFLLMKPNTLKIIDKIIQFREETGLHPCFTLDAGANVHLLFPKKEKMEILRFVETELVGFCENGQYICDETGMGAREIEISIDS